MSQKIIYLDQHAWINLAQAYFGKNKDMYTLCEKVIKASESECAIFPLSFNHLIETRNRRKTESREKLIEFMAKVSNGYTILPTDVTTEAEIRNAILRRLGFSTINIKEFVIGKGMSHMFGGNQKIVGNIPENVKNIMIKWLDNPDTYKELLKRFVSVDDRNSYIDEIKKLEDERIWIFNTVRDKQRRYEFALARNIISVLTLKIAEICNELHDSVSIFKDWTENDFVKVINLKKNYVTIIEEIPTFYIPFILSYYSECDFNRKIIINDINDIYHLTMAIPYCDIVLPDRMFAGIAKQRLGQIYPAIILSSIKELEEHI